MTDVFPLDCAVIDTHTHIFPPELCNDRSVHLVGDAWFNYLYRSPKALLVSAEDLVASMDDAGIQRSIACGFPWADAGLCREHNAYMMESALRFPDRISWLGIVSPGSGSAADDARWCLEHGAVGLGELNADAQGFDLRDPTIMQPIADLCIAAGRPVMIHSSEPLGHDYPGKGAATPDKMLALASAFPELTIIAAHWGGGLPFYELMPEVAESTKRVVYDSGASTHLYRFQIFRSVLDIAGQDRVLFGSDYPVLKQRRFLERTLATPWKHAEERVAVLGGNAARIFRLPNPNQVNG